MIDVKEAFVIDEEGGKKAVLLDFSEYQKLKAYINELEIIVSQVDKSSLVLQQEVLKKIWDSPEEDIYDL